MPLPQLPDVPMVSLLMAAYNHERYIVDAVESALAVEWPRDRMEIIVVDDGSTDRTGELLDAYSDRVRVLRQANQGLHAAVGRLMDEARGDVIITGPAGDDMAVPERARILVAALQANPGAGMVYSDMEVIDDLGSTIAPSYMDLNALRRPSGRLRGQLLQGNIVSGGGCAMRGCLKDVFHPIPAHAAWEDFWWAWSVSGVADVVHVPDITYRYRQHASNMAHGVTGDRAITAILTDVRFRRWMFGAIRPSEATADEMLHGLRGFYLALRHVTDESGMSFRECFPVSAEEEMAADAQFDVAREAAGEGDIYGAALALMRAVAASPHRIEDTSLLRVIFDANATAPMPHLTTRRFVVSVDGEELRHDPGLLAAYGRCFDASDDATLVIHTPRWSPATAAEVLPALVAAAGLDGDDGPDMVAIAHIPGGLPALLRRTDAWLSGSPVGLVPTFDAESMSELRALERRGVGSPGATPWLPGAEARTPLPVI